MKIRDIIKKLRRFHPDSLLFVEYKDNPDFRAVNIDDIDGHPVMFVDDMPDPEAEDEDAVAAPTLIVRRVNTTEAARILGCSSSLVRWLIHAGELKNIERPGKRVYLLDADEVVAYRTRKMDQATNREVHHA